MTKRMFHPTRILKSVYWLFAGTRSQRRRVRQEAARLAASLFGDFPVGEDYKLWREDAQFLEDYRRLCPGNVYSQERKYVLRELARATSALDGCMAECGCYEGASAYFMAQASPETPLYLFDSFDGLPAPGDLDRTRRPDERTWQEGDLKASEAVARNNLKDFSNVVFHKGWIPETFSTVGDKVFRLVHIDVDLYQPTKDSLEFFYPRMTDRGAIVLDDYGSTLCPGAYRATSEFIAEREESVIHLPTMQGVILIDNSTQRNLEGSPPPRVQE
jgi:predicted O-methyltransferase YrrM